MNYWFDTFNNRLNELYNYFGIILHIRLQEIIIMLFLLILYVHVCNRNSSLLHMPNTGARGTELSHFLLFCLHIYFQSNFFIISSPFPVFIVSIQFYCNNNLHMPVLYTLIIIIESTPVTVAVNIRLY